MGAVLVCAKGYPPDIGGVQSYGEHVVRAYLQRGLTPVVLTSRPGSRGWQTVTYPEGAVRLLNVGEGPQPLVFVRLLRAARGIVRGERFDFCHATTWKAGMAVSPWFSGPLVLTVHGREITIVPAPLRPAMRWLVRRARLIVAVSESTRSAARKAVGPRAGEGRWIVSHNGLSYRDAALAGARDGEGRGGGRPLRLYTFCRFVARKNIDGALHAVRMVRDRGITGFEYVIAGDGPECARLRELATALGLDDIVRFAGPLPEEEVVPGYRRADIFLHPQIAAAEQRDIEGFGLTIADAMALGALAIAGRDGGPAEFIEQGRTGLLVDGGDHGDIADALELALRDASLRHRVAAAGREWCIANLSWATHVARILETLAVR